MSLTSAPPATVDIYVDGSYQDGRTGYGAVVLHGGQVMHEMCGPVPPDHVNGTRQVAGELMAVGHAIRWCKSQGIPAARIFFDYEGVGAWAEARWKAKNDLTQRYAAFVRSCGMKLQFIKVKAHTGNVWNERADVLARHGATAADLDPEDQERVHDLEVYAERMAKRLTAEGLHVSNLGVHNRMFIRLKITGPAGEATWDLYHSSHDKWTPRYNGRPDADIRRKVEAAWEVIQPRYA